ncbi:phage late control D [gamma proteobacterium HTCC5015]|nr:phage late control D [gamma proteobacterium HTCC5015]
MTPIQNQPAYRLSVNGNNITAKLQGRLLRLTLVTERGEKADQLTLELDDSDGKLDIPPTKAELSLAIGWVGSTLVEKGTFTVDEASHSGPPDVLTIRARSANLIDALPGKKSRSWENATLQDIVTDIAKEHGYQPIVGQALAGIRRTDTQQTNESDMHLLQRLAREYDATATVKAGRLLFVKKGAAQTASGQPMPSLSIARSDTTSHRYQRAERDVYTGVKAQWNDKAGAQLQSVIVGETENLKTLRSTYAAEEYARSAAQAEFDRIRRGRDELELTLTTANPELDVEWPIKATSFKAEINKKDWVAKSVSQSLTEQEFTTSTTAETTV